MAENGAHAHDWDAQFEQLSAYADGELEAAACAVLESHLPTCVRCRGALADLHATRALLRALPATEPLRSFALPVPDELRVAAPSPTPARPRRPQREPLLLPRAAQWLGGVAAAAGLAILLGSALIHTPASGSTVAGPSYGAANVGQTTATVPPATPVGPQPQHQTGVPEQSPTESGGNATPTPQPTPTANSPAESQPEAPIGPIAGGGLLVVGGGVFAAGAVAERRRRRERI